MCRQLQKCVAEQQENQKHGLSLQAGKQEPTLLNNIKCQSNGKNITLLIGPVLEHYMLDLLTLKARSASSVAQSNAHPSQHHANTPPLQQLNQTT
jgi:hypothetical protein